MYDYYEELEHIHRTQEQRYSRKGRISDNSWQFESWGCADCHSATMSSIYAAYVESKVCDEW